jgi:cell division septal protein FtsQ
MNTRNDTPTRIRISEDEVQPQVRKPQRRKPNKKVLSVLRFGMLLSGAVIVVLALTMLILPIFKINKIVVEGNSYYDDETVAQMAGISAGDELFGWDMQKKCLLIILEKDYLVCLMKKQKKMD